MFTVIISEIKLTWFQALLGFEQSLLLLSSSSSLQSRDWTLFYFFGFLLTALSAFFLSLSLSRAPFFLPFFSFVFSRSFCFRTLSRNFTSSLASSVVLYLKFGPRLGNNNTLQSEGGGTSGTGHKCTLALVFQSGISCASQSIQTGIFLSSYSQPPISVFLRRKP